MESPFSLLRQAFLEGVRGVSPKECVASFLAYEGGTLRVRSNEEWIDITPGRGGNLYVIATGKAALGMYGGAVSVAGVPHRGIIATLAGDRTFPGATIFRCGHPLPDEGSIEAANAILATVEEIRPEDTLVYLLSGGSSSMVALPVKGVPFPDKVETVREVMRGGASITELNTVRTALSAVKGGKIAGAVKTTRACVLLMSDVPGNDLSIIGSGPLYHLPPATSPLRVLEDLSITPSVSPSVLGYLRGEEGRTESAVPTKNILHTIVGDNRRALESAAAMLSSMNYEVLIDDEQYGGEARTTGYLLAEKILSSRNMVRAPKAAFVAGGETVVTVRGGGSGGRNQEMAMGAASRLEGISGVVGLCGATDGIDGMSPAAGGFFDGFQVGRARKMGLDPAKSLADNDSFHFLEKIGYSFQTGPTGTNVMDLTICLLHDRR